MIESKVLITAIENAGYEPYAYSGRGMYGRRCVGVDTNSAFALGLKVAIALRDLEDTYSDVSADDLEDTRICMDGMGLGSVIYFPEISWPPECEECGDTCNQGESCCEDCAETEVKP